MFVSLPPKKKPTEIFKCTNEIHKITPEKIILKYSDQNIKCTNV